MTAIAIVNYGVGNLRSICRGIERAGAEPVIIRDLKNLDRYDGLVLPGQGAFKTASRLLKGEAGRLREAVDRGLPILGICLGLQLFFTASEEGGLVEGLGFIEGYVKKLPSTVKIPHMGWNTLKLVKRGCPLLEGIPDGSFVYFVHSYYVLPEDRSSVVATTKYGVEFPSVIWKGTLFGTQFHPEKSGAVGHRMLRNFVELCGGKK